MTKPKISISAGLVDEAVDRFKKLLRTEKRMERLTIELQDWLSNLNDDELSEYAKITNKIARE